MERKKKKVPGKPTRTLDSVKDERFAHVLKNPIYRPVPKKERKVDIDKRFQGMFKDEKFKLRYKVDKRGRPVETTTDENLKRYYNLVEDDDEEKPADKKQKQKKRTDESPEASSSEEGGSGGSDSSDESDIEGNVKEDEILKSKFKSKLDKATRKKLHRADVDFARGEANFVDESSSDDDDSSTDDDEAEAPMEHDWGELDKDAPRTDDSTRRLALCNMDWDRVRAVDLMVLLGSFLPAGGVIKSVTIYPSEFGKERMAEEEREGPRELRENGSVKIKKEGDEEDEDNSDEEGSNDSEDEDEEGEGSQYHREKLRQYQLNRLKYFYAVAEFDSAQTAEKVYNECDGMEYESSAAKVDLRFIPDDVSFDDNEPKEVCTELPDATKYRPRFFTTTALQQVKVDLTWDETDPLRKELTEKIFDPKEKVDDDDIRAYLATSSSESDDDEEIKEEVTSENEQAEQSNEKHGTTKKSKEDAIAKYKALLQSIDSTEKKKKEKDMEMEITWGVGLKDKAEKLVKNKLEEKEKAKRTPWEEMLDKRKDKRRMRKQERKRKGSDSDSDDNASDSAADEGGDKDGGQMFSDDDVDVDMSDEFFQSELRDNEIFKNNPVKLKKKEGKKKKHEKSQDKEDDGKTNAELELLLMDEDDNKRHFSLKKILEEENDSKSKKKKRNKKKRMKLDEKKDNVKDDFEIDLEDQRFSALFRSHHFNVDPSDPNFKKTKAMEKIIAEKQKRRDTSKGTETGSNVADKIPSKEDNGNKIADKNGSSATDNDSKAATATKKDEIHRKAELSYLVKSIKRNTENLKSKKANVKSKY